MGKAEVPRAKDLVPGTSQLLFNDQAAEGREQFGAWRCESTPGVSLRGSFGCIWGQGMSQPVYTMNWSWKTTYNLPIKILSSYSVEVDDIKHISWCDRKCLVVIQSYKMLKGKIISIYIWPLELFQWQGLSFCILMKLFPCSSISHAFAFHLHHVGTKWTLRPYLKLSYFMCYLNNKCLKSETGCQSQCK